MDGWMESKIIFINTENIDAIFTHRYCALSRKSKSTVSRLLGAPSMKDNLVTNKGFIERYGLIGHVY